VRALPARERRAVLAAEIMRGVYGDLLRRIEAAHYDVFSEVVRVPRKMQAVIAMRTWGRIRLGRPHRS
jgi:phytoene/squalene synthetase